MNDSRVPDRSEGKIALVTGARGGIGQAVVERLRRDGATVWATDLGDESSNDGRVIRRPLDVTDPDAWRKLVAEVEATGPIDQLHLCHGISQKLVPALELELADWQRVQDVNLTSVFLGIRATAPAMVARGYGRIVAVASIAAKEASKLEHTYAASKAGVVALVKSVGKELAADGVTVNSIAPGPVRTPLWDRLTDEVKNDRMSRTPMGRPAEPAEIASLAAWLASPEASYITAQCLDSSGGRAVY